MSRTFQLLVIAYLVCSTAVILLHLAEALGLLLGILGLILVLRILERWRKEYGRCTDPNFDENDAVRLQQSKFLLRTIMMFLAFVYVFPVSDWKFWLCTMCLVLNSVPEIRRLANSPDESMPASSRKDAAQSRKWQLCLETILVFLMVVGLFPVSDWKFWAGMTWLVVAAAFTHWRIRREQFAIST